VPLRVDGVVIPFLIALTMIGALAGVLRWTFSGRSGLRARGTQTDSASSSEEAGRPPEPPLTGNPATSPSAIPPSVFPPSVIPPSVIPPPMMPPPMVPPPVMPPPVMPPSVGSDTPEESDTLDTRRRGAPDTPDTPTESADDFGLLATVAIVTTVREADQIRARLRAAGIRATTAPGPQGRYRVLVFESEVHRARRLGGSAT